MPRNGANIYSIPPGTEGFPDTTIESAKYNTYVHDVETDLNTPRPISAGGTGATNANDALSNLGAERSSQQVTNYDTHVWYPGSFYSAIGATGAPTAAAGQTATHPFVGWVISSDPPATPPTNQNVVVRAHDQSNVSTPGRVYVREKKAGVWGVWAVDGSTGIPAETPPVDPADGALWWDSISGQLYVYYRDVDSAAWVIASPSPDPELFVQKAEVALPPVNPGDAANKAYVDAADALKVDRAGDTMTGALTIDPAGNAAASLNLRGGTSTSYVDTPSWQFGQRTTGGDFVVSEKSVGVAMSVGDIGIDFFREVYANNGITTANLDCLGQVYCNGPVVSRHVDAQGAGVFCLDGAGNMKGYFQWEPGTSEVRMGSAVPPSGGLLIIRPDTTLTYNSAAAKPGGGPWSDLSDSRIKNVLGNYTNGLAAVMQLQPVLYTFKGNDTVEPPKGAVPYSNSAHYLSATAGTEYVGLVAQDAEAAIPGCVTRASGYIDGVSINDIRSLDTTPLIFALINAVKELEARIKVLEG